MFLLKNKKHKNIFTTLIQTNITRLDIVFAWLWHIFSRFSGLWFGATYSVLAFSVAAFQLRTWLMIYIWFLKDPDGGYAPQPLFHAHTTHHCCWATYLEQSSSTSVWRGHYIQQFQAWTQSVLVSTASRAQCDCLIALYKYSYWTQLNWTKFCAAIKTGSTGLSCTLRSRNLLSTIALLDAAITWVNEWCKEWLACMTTRQSARTVSPLDVIFVVFFLLHKSIHHSASYARVTTSTTVKMHPESTSLL